MLFKKDYKKPLSHLGKAVFLYLLILKLISEGQRKHIAFPVGIFHRHRLAG